MLLCLIQFNLKNNNPISIGIFTMVGNKMFSNNIAGNSTTAVV